MPIFPRRFPEAPLLATIAFATFLVSLSGGSLAPFLKAMAGEFDVAFGTVAHLFSVQAVTWGLCAFFAGRVVDRLGARPVILSALVVMAATRFWLALSPGFTSAFLAQAVSGVAGGSVLTAAYTAVSAAVAPERRGRGVSWITLGQSLSLLAGVPLMTLLASWLDWRGAIHAHGLAIVVLWLVLARVLPRAVRGGAAPERVALGDALDNRLVRLLVSGLLDRVTFASITIYLASFLATAYGLGFADLSVGLAIVALGNFIGNALGGRLADKVHDRIALFAAALAATAVFNLPLMLFAPGYAVSVALGFVAMLVNALGRAPYLAAVTQVPDGVRGTVMGLNVMLSATSWLGAALIGGLVDAYGFGVVAITGAALGASGAALAFSLRRRPAGGR